LASQRLLLAPQPPARGRGFPRLLQPSARQPRRRRHACLPPETCSGGRGGPKPGGDVEMILTLAQVQLESV